MPEQSHQTPSSHILEATVEPIDLLHIYQMPEQSYQTPLLTYTRSQNKPSLHILDATIEPVDPPSSHMQDARVKLIDTPHIYQMQEQSQQTLLKYTRSQNRANNPSPHILDARIEPIDPSSSHTLDARIELTDTLHIYQSQQTLHACSISQNRLSSHILDDRMTNWGDRPLSLRPFLEITDNCFDRLR